MTSKVVFFCSMIVLLVSCSSVTPVPTPLNIATSTQTTSTATLEISTPSPIPPTPDPKIRVDVIPGFNVTPQPDEQVYMDPEGWYRINLPASMKRGDQPNVFYTTNLDTLEIGYLSALGFVSEASMVCAWLANVEFDPAENTTDFNYYGNGCKVFSVPGRSNQKTTYWVYENPGAEPEHRFVYIKQTGSADLDDINFLFFWTKDRKAYRPEHGFVPLSLEEISFWKSVAPLPSGVSVTEYNLAEGAPSPYERSMTEYTPIDAWPTTQPKRLPSPTPARIKLEDLGYTLKYVDSPTGLDGPCKACLIELYRNGQLLFHDIYAISDIYRFSTKKGPMTAFTFVSGENIFLAQNNVITPWRDDSSPPWKAPAVPILVQDKLLWLGVEGGASKRDWVRTSTGETVFSFMPGSTFWHYSAESKYVPIGKFLAWQDHWILTFNNFLVEDGELINKNLGFQEIFGWNLIQDKPVYFFRKGSRVGLSYNGQVLPLKYEDVAHLVCCWANGVMSLRNDVLVEGDSARFYGKRDGIWYYVVVKFRK